MPKGVDAVRQFTVLRGALQRERSELQQRLKQIDAALNGGEVPVPFIKAPTLRGTVQKAKARTRGVRNKLTVREAVEKVTAAKALPLREIVEGMQRLGYKFASKNPKNSVGAYLYSAEGKKHFKRANGKFARIKQK